jgi:hypothetical protein
MIFKTRPSIKKQYPTIANLGIDNLIVSGCSFTYNHHDSTATAWPYYLKDLGGFTQVLDCSMPGAGNQHVSHALQWALEMEPPDPKDSLVIVMWTGNDRDDYICPTTNIKPNSYPFKFCYSDAVETGITGGSYPEATGNTVRDFKPFSTTKTKESRAIENYLYMTQTWNYLANRGYKFVFLNFLNSQLPSRSEHFDIGPLLPLLLKNKLKSMIADIIDPYTWAVKTDQLWEDDYHPSPNGHLDWTRNILLPYLKTKFD